MIEVGTKAWRVADDAVDVYARNLGSPAARRALVATARQVVPADIDSLLNAGGIQSMMWTISLMLIALGFGGALERTGCLEAIITSRRT